MIWLKFAAIQLVQLIAAALGLVMLALPCALQAWNTSPDKSIKDGVRVVDEWSWPLNVVYGNPEDGVSGQTALVWVDGVLAPYLPTAGPRWRAYKWSALRNSVDGLKYVFAVPGVGPLKTAFGFRFGWQVENGFNVPILGRV